MKHEIGIIILICCTVFLFGTEIGNCGGRNQFRAWGCTGACSRRGTEISHTHENMCVCQDGHTLTMDLGGMYREMDPSE